jgi:hypothetical protein
MGWMPPGLYPLPPFLLHILQKMLTLLSQKQRNKVGKKFENGQK